MFTDGHSDVDFEDMFMDGHFLPGFQTRGNEMGMIQNYKYEHTYLEDIFTTWLFSKTAMASPAMDPGLGTICANTHRPGLLSTLLRKGSFCSGQ